ncbi:DUF2268 domain-containing protein [Metabacillus lacus]|uniref:DUF2268 domain-containing protein n=1 Tax=Metabacillus lacus TaxID=1983721 RepID=UPI0014784721
MSVIDTAKWLEESCDPEEICRRLRVYFEPLNEYQIARYLSDYGMFNRHTPCSSTLSAFKKHGMWEFIKKEEAYLKNLWQGPDVSIFIFPCDVSNRKIQKEYKGKSGLAFKDKLFLFLSPDCNKKEVSAVFTHEYHHVCRLAKDRKDEEKYTILDTMILEGLAENAVRERFGEKYTASWTAFYTDTQLTSFWLKYFSENNTLDRSDKRFTKLMFGTGLYPKMLGYAVGYFTVKKYMEVTGKKTKDLLSVKSEEVIKEVFHKT